MKKIFILIIFFLSSCGYQPLYTNKNSKDFIFAEITLVGDLKINKKIISSLNIKKNTENYKFEKIILTNKKEIIETSKNSKGQVDSYKMNLTIGLIIEDKNNVLTEKTLSDTFAYKNLDNKFDLSQYENQIENNLLNKITQELIFYLNF